MDKVLLLLLILSNMFYGAGIPEESARDYPTATLECEITEQPAEGSADECIEEFADLIDYEMLKIEKPFNGGELEDICTEIEYSNAIELDNIEVNLYPTFTDQKKALKNIQLECEGAIKWLQRKFSLKSFSHESWSTYKDCLYAWDVKTSYVSEEILDQLDLLDGFFDIYENESENNEIIGELDTINKVIHEEGISSVDKVEICENLAEELVLTLPEGNARMELASEIEESFESYNDVKEDVVDENNLKIVQTRRTIQPETVNDIISPVAYGKNSKFNVSKGVTYANKHATKINRSGYGYLKGRDCTNFASQIKYEGGVPSYKQQTSGGWSHWVEYHAQGSVHKYSTKWVKADSFVKFFGVKKKYTYGKQGFTNMSKAVKKGSFIAHDKNNDGDWDHLGFVTVVTKTSRKFPDGKKTYYDFKVAQHSSDYHLYVSHKDNGWDKAAQNNSKYVCAIVN